jgi:ferrochelatase
MEARRSATPGDDPRFVSAVRDLLLERAAVERGESVLRPALGALGASWDRCDAGCCENAHSERPTLAGKDSEQYA